MPGRASSQQGGAFLRRRPRASLLLAGLAFLLCLSPGWACAEEWFDAYQRGERALRQGKGVDAVVLLERAAQKRPEPGTNVITYGTNRVEKYYPYLRLAEAYLLVGDPAAAREALRRSELRGKEPQADRIKLLAAVQAAERQMAAAATPPPTPAPAPLPTLAPTPTPRQATTEPTPSADPATAITATPPPTPAPVTRPAVPLPPALGTLELQSDPAGATAFLGSRLLGTTPLRVELAAGEYQLTLRREGAADLQFPVLVVAGRRTVESRSLLPTAPATHAQGQSAVPEPFADSGSLIVVSDPPGASAYLDDEFLGNTDPRSGRLAKSGVPTGRHRLRLAIAEREPFEQDVEIEAGQPTTVRGELPRGQGPSWLLPGLSALGGLALVGLIVAALRRRGVEEKPTVARAAATGSRGDSTAARSPLRTSPRAATATPVPATPTAPDRPRPGGVATPRPGERFGSYVLLESLGRGGMAAVFKAERNGELCALKRPLPSLLEEPEFMERFLREAELGHTLHHPNIIRIFERGEVDGLPYFTMELVVGETLHARLKRQGAMPPRDATLLVSQVAEALDYAHLKGVIHRDLKPSNVMLLQDGTVKVMDYGIARARRFEGLTMTGAFLGTPDYVAPETAEGRGTDGRSDLYSLGVVFYELLTGKRPFVGQTPFETLKKQCSEPPTPPSMVSPDCPRELEAIILKLLRKVPDERHASAEELLVELRAYLNRPNQG